jgi:secreted Zn-dependent insulinase-like peptidase
MKKSLVEHLNKPHNNLSEFSMHNYEKVVDTNNVMNFTEICIDTIKEMTLNDVIEFYDQYFYNNDNRILYDVRMN